jgi:hypothetical protein
MTSMPEDDEFKKDTPAMGQGNNEDEEEEESEAEEAPEEHAYMKMFDADIMREFLGKSWVVFSSFFGLYYLLQFGLALMCANFYSQSAPLRLTTFEYKPVNPDVDYDSIKIVANIPNAACGFGITDADNTLEARVKSAMIYD